MKVEEVLQCSFPLWYHNFEKVTFKSVVIPLPQEVLSYLLENDQLVLPKECNDDNYDGLEDDYEDFGDVDWTKDDEVSPEIEQKSFPEFSRRVKDIIEDLGGEVFIKLNWSCPKDAAWVSLNNSLKCTTLSQVYLLLKSSDFISHDLTFPFSDCSDEGEEVVSVPYSLVLRKWAEINPSTEWRCFVKQGQLIAISQRDTSSYYQHIEKDEASIKQDILSFFREQILDQFPLSSYAFDVTRPGKDKVTLVDINPFGVTTDPLLYDWPDLFNWSNSDGMELRYIRESMGVQPNPCRQYCLPLDMIDLASGADPYKLVDFLRLQGQAEGGHQSQDSDSD
jgi:hypothetical protein